MLAKEMLHVKNEAAASTEDKQELSNAEGKKGTDQLLCYQHLKGKSWGDSKLIRSRWEEIAAKFSQGSGLPKSFLKTRLQVSRPWGRDWWWTENPRKAWEMLPSWLSAFDSLQSLRHILMDRRPPSSRCSPPVVSPGQCLCSRHVSSGKLRQNWRPARSQSWAGILMFSVSFVNCYKTLETLGYLKVKRK